jgi:hypothetical protein
MSGEGVGEADEAGVGLLGDHVLVERAHLLAAQVVDHGPQVGFSGLDPFDETTLLEAEQDLGQDEGIQAAQAHLAAEADRRLGPPPSQLVEGRVRPVCVTPPELVGLAVVASRVAALAGAGRHQARPQGGQAHRARMSHERVDLEAEAAALVVVGPAALGGPRDPLAGTSGHHTGCWCPA